MPSRSLTSTPLAGSTWGSLTRELSERARTSLGLCVWWWDSDVRALRLPGADGDEVCELPVAWGEGLDHDLRAAPGLDPLRAVGFTPQRLVRDEPVQGRPVGVVCTRTGVGRAPSGPRLDAAAEELTAQVANFLALERATRHAEQLSDVYRAAVPVSADLALDGVLATVCQRARSLTGADSSYITLIDSERADVYVRAWDGIRTEAFRHNRLRLGSGLGGLVAETGLSYASSDYLHDGRFVHEVDPIVSAEGLVAILGVPLRTPTGIIGVLYASHHGEFTWDDGDRERVGMLAEHAAVAIENAQLYQELRAMLERERTQREALANLLSVNEELTRLSLATQDLDSLLSEVSLVLGFPVAVKPVATGPRSVQVAAGGVTLGWLEPTSSPSASDALQSDEQTVALLEQAARVLAGHLMHDRALAQAQYRFSGDFLSDLLRTEQLHSPSLIRRAAHLGIDLTVPMAVGYVLVSGDPTGVESLLQVMGGGVPGQMLAGYGSGLLLVWPGRLGHELADSVLPRLRASSVAFTLGMASAPTNLEHLQAAIDEAVTVARGARALARWGVVSSASDVRAYGAMLAGGDELRRFAQQVLKPLLDYDRAHDSALVPTLAAYLDCAASPTATARRMNLHINSLYYRLQRLTELGGFSLDDPDVRFELQLALRVLQTTTGLLE